MVFIRFVIQMYKYKIFLLRTENKDNKKSVKHTIIDLQKNTSAFDVKHLCVLS